LQGSHAAGTQGSQAAGAQGVQQRAKVIFGKQIFGKRIFGKQNDGPQGSQQGSQGWQAGWHGSQAGSQGWHGSQAAGPHGVQAHARRPRNFAKGFHALPQPQGSQAAGWHGSQAGSQGWQAGWQAAGPHGVQQAKRPKKPAFALVVATTRTATANNERTAKRFISYSPFKFTEEWVEELYESTVHITRSR
jgi:hypothetical protein